jgi:hypothetical protein
VSSDLIWRYNGLKAGPEGSVDMGVARGRIGHLTRSVLYKT